MNRKQPFHNFTVDHMTLLFDQKLYPIIYATFRIIFGTTPDDLLYEKRRVQKDTGKEMSMTFATRVGEWEANQNKQLHYPQTKEQQLKMKLHQKCQLAVAKLH